MSKKEYFGECEGCIAIIPEMNIEHEIGLIP
jgi:hypothetical protein